MFIVPTIWRARTDFSVCFFVYENTRHMKTRKIACTCSGLARTNGQLIWQVHGLRLLFWILKVYEHAQDAYKIPLSEWKGSRGADGIWWRKEYNLSALNRVRVLHSNWTVWTYNVHMTERIFFFFFWLCVYQLWKRTHYIYLKNLTTNSWGGQAWQTMSMKALRSACEACCGRWRNRGARGRGKRGWGMDQWNEGNWYKINRYLCSTTYRLRAPEYFFLFCHSMN